MSSKLKLFTLEDANAQIPKLRVAMAEARALALRLSELQAEVDALVKRHGEQAMDTPENPDRERYWRIVGQLRELQQRIEAGLEEVRFLGAEVKDVAQGLVDFTADRKGELVFLCWKLGEPRIAHWHSLEGGFTGRRPIGEF